MTQSRTRSKSGSQGPLLASALVITALILVQAAKLQPAVAATASGPGMADGDMSVLTARSGRGGETEPDELFYVLDNRAEVLLVYEVTDARQRLMELRDGGSLRDLFARVAP